MIFSTHFGEIEQAVIKAARAKSQNSPFVSIAALADILGVSVRTVRRLQAKGDLPPRIKRGRELGYRRPDVDAWLAARGVVSTT